MSTRGDEHRPREPGSPSLTGIENAILQPSLVGEALEAGPVGVLVADDRMRYVAANEYVCKLLGYSRNQLLRLRVTDVVPQPQTPQEFAEMTAGRLPDWEGNFTRVDGTSLPVRTRNAATHIYGLPFYVAVVWPTDEEEPAGA